MKKYLLFITLIVLFSACEKQISITPPTILNGSDIKSVGEEALFEVVEFAEIDNVRLLPESYEWEITSGSNIFTPDSIYDNKMLWTPSEVGIYIISVTILYDGNKEIEAIKEIEVELTTDYFQSMLVGTWRGLYKYNGIVGKNVELIIDETGHFVGRTIGGGGGSALYWGSNIDISCSVIRIEEIHGKIGNGEIQIPYTGSYCEEFILDDLEFYSDYDSLVFQVKQSSGSKFTSITEYLKRQ